MLKITSSAWAVAAGQPQLSRLQIGETNATLNGFRDGHIRLGQSVEGVIMAGLTRKPSRSKAARRTGEARTGARRDDFVKVRFSKQVAKNLGEIQSLPTFMEDAGELTTRARATIVDQALVMIDQTYVHLPLKRAMHAIDPVQRLRLVKQRLKTYSERAFHNEMISIFLHLRDLHTNYILPEPFSNGVAFLPFHVEEYFEGAGSTANRVFIVTEVSGKLSDPNFKPGVKITHWNGIQMDTAVEINADREAGSNLDARHSQGLETLTNRWMGMSLPPAEDWVVIRYLPANGNGPSREARFAWQVSLPPPESGGDGSALGMARHSAGRANRMRIGLDAKGEMQRRFRKLLFAPKAVSWQREMKKLGARAPQASRAFYEAMTSGAWTVSRSGDDRPRAPEWGAAPRASESKARRQAARRSKPSGAVMLGGVDLTAHSIMPDVIKDFGAVAGSKGNFGYIRLVTFDFEEEIDTFIGEFIRILTLLPQEGLILDVRGNGGGYIEAGERLLQTMTPGLIEPERFHLINTPLTLRMCQQKAGELVDWKASAEESVEIGAAFTQGFPLTAPEDCNDIGQIYQGPVVLIVDAGCYSTTDIFAAGFQDHKVGRVLGTSGHTGAGGANVWEHADLMHTLPRRHSPFVSIRSGASFRVALRRSTRVGHRSGEPLEDLGVVPDEIYRMTRNDVLNHNADMIAHACKMLAKMPRQRLTVSATKQNDGSLKLTVTTNKIHRVDIVLDGRTIHTVDVKKISSSFDLAGPAAGASLLECRGFRHNTLVASTRLKL
jgi:C-terminal processing protease CtpA/Prc